MYHRRQYKNVKDPGTPMYCQLIEMRIHLHGYRVYTVGLSFCGLWRRVRGTTEPPRDAVTSSGFLSGSVEILISITSNDITYPDPSHFYIVTDDTRVTKIFVYEQVLK